MSTAKAWWNKCPEFAVGTVLGDDVISKAPRRNLTIFGQTFFHAISRGKQQDDSKNHSTWINKKKKWNGKCTGVYYKYFFRATHLYENTVKNKILLRVTTLGSPRPMWDIIMHVSIRLEPIKNKSLKVSWYNKLSCLSNSKNEKSRA